MKFPINNVLAATLITLLSACGGGEDSEPNLTHSSNSSVETEFVSGAFKNALETGDYFDRIDPKSGRGDEAFGFQAYSCSGVNQEYYFESGRVQVYGSQSLPESDFNTVATWVENGLDKILPKMGGLTFDELMNRRRNIATWSYRLGAWQYQNTDMQKPDGWEIWSSTEQEAYSRARFSELPLESQKSYVIEERSSYAPVVESDFVFTQKVRVCLTESNDSFMYGSGEFLGLNVAAPSIQVPHDVQTIINHELVHMIQMGMIYQHGWVSMPRWFLEGQAVAIAGQQIAKIEDRHKFNIPSITFFQDENGHDQHEM